MMEAIVKKKLYFRFHNPNDEETTIREVLKVIIESNEHRVQNIVENGLLNEDSVVKN